MNADPGYWSAEAAPASPTTKRQTALPTRWRHAIGRSDLPANARLVAHVIGAHMNKFGQAFPSMPTIADEAGLDLRTVRNHLRLIAEVGLLAISPQPRGGGRGVGKFYQAVIPLHLEKGYNQRPPSGNGRGTNADTSAARRGTTVAQEGVQPLPPEVLRSTKYLKYIEASMGQGSSRKNFTKERRPEELNENSLKIDGRTIRITRLADGRIKAANPADDDLVDAALAWLEADKPKSATGTEG